MKKPKRYLAAILLLPVCWGITVSLWYGIRPFKDVPEGSFYLLAGMATYLAFQWVFFRPMRTYVFGHELTHAVAAWMSGASVKKFKVSKHGGSVTVSKTNLFVALAPYIFPIYSLILLGLYVVVDRFVFELDVYWKWFLWILGGTLAFHGALTFHTLRQGQPDLKQGGRFLSAVLIYLSSTLLIVAMLSLLFPRTVSWKRFLYISGRETVSVVEKAASGGYALWNELARP